MNPEVNHSPEIILEYFKTLKEWHKDKFNLDTSSEVVQMNEDLVLLREDLNKIRLSIIDESDSIKSINNEIDDINQNIASTEKEISELRNRISTAQSEHLNIINKIKSIEALERPSNYVNESIPRSKSAGKFRLILAIIRNDIEIIYLDFKKAASNFNVKILLQYLIGCSVGLILLINFSFPVVKIISLIPPALYVLWRTRSVFSSKGQRFNSQGKQIRIYQDTNISNIRYEQQDLEMNIGKLQSQLNHHEDFVNQYRREQRNLLIKIDQTNRSILDLNNLIDQGVETYQKSAEIIVDQIRAKKMDRLSYLEVLFQKWLKEYIVDLTENARRKLGLVGIEVNDPVALKATPITVWVGVTERTSPSLIVKDSLTEETASDEISELYIDLGEFESQAAYEGSKRKYGVYEFLVIFLCKDFLSYYKCYFNFIRRQTVNEEYREYLYKNIVFTKLQEKSSVNMKNYGDSKQVYSKSLTISTNDGKTLCFQIPKSRGGSNPLELDRAARTIRNLLRQCRQDDSD